MDLGSSRSSLDLFGPGFALLRTRDAPGPLAFERAAPRLGLPLRATTLPDRVDHYAGQLTLVRPDGIVAWRGRELPVDIDAVLDRVRGA